MDDIASPPKTVETTAEARCGRCGGICYSDTVREEYDADGNVAERVRIVRGNFRQKLDADGAPTGAVFPFCDCGRR